MKKKHGEFEKMISSVENPKRDFCGGSVMIMSTFLQKKHGHLHFWR